MVTATNVCLAPPRAAVKSKLLVSVRKHSIYSIYLQNPWSPMVIILHCRDKIFGKEKDFNRLPFLFLLATRHLYPPSRGKHMNGWTNMNRQKEMSLEKIPFLLTADPLHHHQQPTTAPLLFLLWSHQALNHLCATHWGEIDTQSKDRSKWLEQNRNCLK